MTFTDFAELVWKMAEEKNTQEQIAKIMGWSRSQVSQYVNLQWNEKDKKGIHSEVWKVIATTFELVGSKEVDDMVAEIATKVAIFNERILRDLISLTPSQQLELVKDLAEGKITKNKFKDLASRYQARNEMTSELNKQLEGLDDNLLEKGRDEILSGHYDKDWIEKGKDSTKFEKLLTSLKEEWEQKTSIRIIQGDFYEEVKKIPAQSIDLVITDPPYNISELGRKTTPSKEKPKSPKNTDLGEWDKEDREEYLKKFPIWASEFKRILKTQGSGYIFCAHQYLSHLEDAIRDAGMKVKSIIVWCKNNASISPVTTNYISAVELILYFTNCESGHTFNMPTEKEDAFNYITLPLCQGNERLKDAKGDTIHPTQKPESLIRRLMEIFSNRGDVTFDGFMGTGTVARIAKDNGRKFIGIEIEEEYVETTQRRLSD